MGEISPVYINFWKTKSFYFFLKFYNLVLFSLRTAKDAAKDAVRALALSYTSSSEMPTLSYTWSLKKIPLSGGASPYRPSQGVPRPPFQFCAHLLPVHVGL